MISYALESMIAIKDELEPFIIPHWEELGLDHQDVPVALDWSRYTYLDEQSKLHCVTVRKDGVLIGYHITVLATMLHYKDTLHGVVDLYYIKPEHRKGRTGLRMFQFAERSLKHLGVTKLITATKLHLDHGRMFEFLGMKPTEMTYTKILKEA